MTQLVSTRAPAADILVHGVALRAKGGVAAAGAVWMPWQRRGDFHRLWRELRDEHGGPSPGNVRWGTVRRKHLDFYEAVVDRFFATRWLGFRALVDPTGGAVGGGNGGGGGKHERERTLASLVRRGFIDQDGAGARHRVRIDDGLDADDVAASALAVDERDSPALQLARLFTGAVRGAHGGEEGRETQRLLAERIAAHCGVTSLASIGAPVGGGFQVWLPRELRIKARA